MPFREQIKKDLNEAVKNKEELKSSVLRMLSAAIVNREKEKRYKISSEKPDFKAAEGEPSPRGEAGRPNRREEELVKESQLTDEELIDVISSEAKKRKEAISEFEKAGRKERAEKEKEELEILQKYLPEQISEEEIRKLVKEAIEKIGAKEPKDIGRVMAELMPKLKGKADGGEVSRIVKELIVPQAE